MLGTSQIVFAPEVTPCVMTIYTSHSKFAVLKAAKYKNIPTAKSHASDVRLFMIKSYGNDTNTMNLISLPMLEKFRLTMQNELHYKPSTIKEKLKRIALAIRYVIRNIDNQEIYYKGKTLTDELEG